MKTRRRLNESAGQTPDPERLAAMVSARLDATERAEMLSQLSRSDAALRAFIDTAAIAHELEIEDASRASASIAWYRRPIVWGSAAAAILAVIGISDARRSGGTSRPETYVGTAVGTSAMLHEVRARHPWDAVRGKSTALSRPQLDARIGALVTDMDAAFASGDSSIASIARELTVLLDQTPAGGSAAEAYRNIAATDGAGTRDAILRARGLAVALDPDLVDLGAWAEAASIAASVGDTAFFNSDATKSVIRRGLRSARVPAAALEALRRIDGARKGRAVDFNRLRADVDQLLGSLTT